LPRPRGPLCVAFKDEGFSALVRNNPDLAARLTSLVDGARERRVLQWRRLEQVAGS
jgi:hypothetical protein